jgi:hypothetical protein
MPLLHHLLHHAPTHLFLSLAAAFVAIPAAGLLWAAVQTVGRRG